MNEWEPITDLPDEWPTLASAELSSLIEVWQTQRVQVSTDAVDDYMSKLRRRWAIESGVIDGLYELNAKTADAMVENGIDKALFIHPAFKPTERDIDAPELVRDQAEALRVLMKTAANKGKISTSLLAELHTSMMQRVPFASAYDEHRRALTVRLSQGKWKLRPNDMPIPDGGFRRHCPVDDVPSEIDRLLAMHELHALASVAPEVEAAWLHHRFLQIHPFQAGNGSVARALASFVLVRGGGVPLVIGRDDSDEYVRALRTADGGDIELLVRLFQRLEKAALLSAVRFADGTKQTTSVAGDLIKLIAKKVADLNKDPRLRWLAAVDSAENAHKATLARFKGLEVDLQRSLPETWVYEIRSLDNTDEEEQWNERPRAFDVLRSRNQINTDAYRSTVWLHARDGQDTMFAIRVSFAGFSEVWKGVAVGGAEVRTMNGRTSQVGDLFQLNYEEPTDDVDRRYEKWLEDVIVEGLEIWRQSI